MSRGVHVPPDQNRKHHRRPDMRVCLTCDHFREKARGAAANQVGPSTMLKPEPSVAKMECCWHWTSAGRTAPRELVMRVYTAGANGGRDCPELKVTPT